MVFHTRDKDGEKQSRVQEATVVEVCAVAVGI